MNGLAHLAHTPDASAASPVGFARKARATGRERCTPMPRTIPPDHPTRTIGAVGGRRVLIVGGGIAGLALAPMLARPGVSLVAPRRLAPCAR